jgi:hypothetical protein
LSAISGNKKVCLTWPLLKQLSKYFILLIIPCFHLQFYVCISDILKKCTSVPVPVLRAIFTKRSKYKVIKI